MSGLFGSSHPQSSIPTRYNGIQISSSSSGNCIPLLYGMQRMPFNLGWYGAFTSTPVTSNTGGGKGGGGSQQTTGYSYNASFIGLICEGPITAISNVWRDKDLTTLAAQGFTFFSGAGGQATWAYLTSNFPSQAIPYDHICYIAAQNYLLGNSASMPNITFEVKAFLVLTGTAITFTTPPAAGALSATLTSAVLTNGTWNITFNDFEVRSCTVVGTTVTWGGELNGNVNVPFTTAAFAGGVYDADPSAFITDYLTEPNHGAGFPASSIGSLVGTNSYQSYCLALGLTMSPVETTQRAASDFITEILQITNSGPVWSAGKLRIIPYADGPVSGNGFSYTPNLTPQFIFTDDDYLEPPELIRKAIADTFNHVRVEYLDRSHEYNTAVAEVSDLGDIATNGERVMSTLNFHQLTNSTAAGTAAQLILQANLYERNTLKFKVRSDYSLLEPMDYIGINDSGLGYVNQVFRITKITDTELDELEIEAMEIPGTIRTSAVYNWAAVQGYKANFGADPGSVQPPVFIEAYETLVGAAGGRQVWIAVAGPPSSIAWGGCEVYISFDNITYTPIGTTIDAARYGVTNTALAVAADPDTTSTLGVTLNDPLQVLGSGTVDDADNNRLMIAVGNAGTLEIMSFENAALVTAGQYNLTYLRRGQYSTSIKSHLSGVPFIRLDEKIFKVMLDPGYLGATLWFKFPSFNVYGRGLQSLATATAYSFTPGNSLTAYNAVSNSTFTASGLAAVFSPMTAFKLSSAAIAWDASVYSRQSFLNGCTAECYPSQTNKDFMLGLTTNPAASNNFSNLAYAIYASGAGTLTIYEAGTAIVTLPGSYTTSTQLAIVYDGKHVQYYVAGVLVRSVPINNQTFFLQVCFDNPGAAVYGLSFSSATQVATNFTIVPMSNNVVCAGTNITSNGQSAVSAWGTRNFKSAQSFDNGAILTFSAVVTSVQHETIGFSTAPATGGTSPNANMMAGWYFNGTTLSAIFNAGIVYNLITTVLSTDVFTLIYDNFTFFWYRNGIVLHTEYAPGQLPLFLFGDIFEGSFMGFSNVAFEAYGQLSPNPFVATGQCVTHDSTASKVGGITAWDSSVYSLNAYSQCHLQFKTSDPTKRFMFGLDQHPLDSQSYTTLDYAWYPSGGTWVIYESGVAIFAFTTAVASDLVAITYDGANIRYYLNGDLKRTVAVTGLLLYASSSFFDPTAGPNFLSFGPGVVLDSVPTSSIDLNAATIIFQNSVGNLLNQVVGAGGVINIASLTVVSPNVDATVLITYTFAGNFSAGTAGDVNVQVAYEDDAAGLGPISFSPGFALYATEQSMTFQFAFAHSHLYTSSKFYMSLSNIGATSSTSQFKHVVGKCEFIKR